MVVKGLLGIIVHVVVIVVGIVQWELNRNLCGKCQTIVQKAICVTHVEGTQISFQGFLCRLPNNKNTAWQKKINYSGFAKLCFYQI